MCKVVVLVPPEESVTLAGLNGARTRPPARTGIRFSENTIVPAKPFRLTKVYGISQGPPTMTLKSVCLEEMRKSAE